MKYKEARCRNGAIFTFEDIRDASKLSIMRQYGLTTLDGEIEIVAANPLDPLKEPYFRKSKYDGLNDNAKDLNEKKKKFQARVNAALTENVIQHNSFRNRIAGIIAFSKTFRIYTTNSIDDTEDISKQNPLAYLPEHVCKNYKWFQESNEKLLSNYSTTWDIKGRDTSICDPTLISPEVIINIILVAPPSLETFRFMCRSSLENNCIYVFFFVGDKMNAYADGSIGTNWNKIKQGDFTTDLFCTFYIKEGFFYELGHPVIFKGHDRIEDGVTVRPEFKSISGENTYWKKYWTFVNQSYFKPIVKKLNPEMEIDHYYRALVK